MKKLVIIPTYNELENIQKMIPAIKDLLPEIHILVVDDGSPDGTAGKVKELGLSFSGIHLLERTEKNGLGKAYLAGFKWALQNDFNFVVQMDADFSHRPIDLVKLQKEIEGKDLVIGSRYVAGGGTQNWSFLRKLISKGGSLYSRLILGFPINDWTGGFNAWKSETLKSLVNLDSIRSEGYSFQIEMKYRALKSGAHYKEVPIVFEERRAGQSKMSLRIVFEAFFRVWSIRFT